MTKCRTFLLSLSHHIAYFLNNSLGWESTQLLVSVQISSIHTVTCLFFLFLCVSKMRTVNEWKMCVCIVRDDVPLLLLVELSVWCMWMQHMMELHICTTNISYHTIYDMVCTSHMLLCAAISYCNVNLIRTAIICDENLGHNAIHHDGVNLHNDTHYYILHGTRRSARHRHSHMSFKPSNAISILILIIIAHSLRI